MPDLRTKIESSISNVAKKWKLEEFSPFTKLLSETAAHESHYGKLDPVNPFRIDPIFLEEMKKPKYQPQLAYLGAKRKDDGSFDLSDMDTQTILAGMQYATKLKPEEDLSSQQLRAIAWKKVYNTKAGKGTPEKYIGSQKLFGNTD